MIARALVLAALFAAAGDPALGAPECVPQKQMRDFLANRFAEVLTGRGIVSNGWLGELYVHRQAGSWSFAITSPEGMTCLMATGWGWEVIDPEDRPPRPIGDGKDRQP